MGDSSMNGYSSTPMSWTARSTAEGCCQRRGSQPVIAPSLRAAAARDAAGGSTDREIQPAFADRAGRELGPGLDARPLEDAAEVRLDRLAGHSQPSPNLLVHVGLGTAEAAEVRVTWPDGETGPWLDVAADEFAVITKDPATADPWTP